MLNNEPKIIVSDLNVFYGNKQAIFDINMSINSKEVTAFIGPSGCGKSTLLRCFNRMNDLIDICKITGNIKLDDLEVYNKKIDIVRLRTRVKVWIYNTIVVRFFGDYIQEDINEYVCDNIHDFDHTEVWSDRD